MSLARTLTLAVAAALVAVPAFAQTPRRAAPPAAAPATATVQPFRDGAQLRTLCATRAGAPAQAECAAYVMGVADVWSEVLLQLKRKQCYPPATTAQQLVDAVNRYIAKTPDAARTSGSSVIIAALGDAFPSCN
jgi:hypothetical protein